MALGKLPALVYINGYGMKIVNLVLNSFVNDSRVLKTSKTLINSGYDVSVVALHDSGLKEHETISNVSVYRIKLVTRSWPKYRLIQILKLFEFVVRFIFRYRKFDVLHCNDLNGFFVGFCCKLTRPKIIIVYDSHEFAINDVPNQSARSIKLKKILEGFLIKFAHGVINVSDSIANEYSRLYNIPKPHLVLNCPAYYEQPKRNLLRESLSIRSDQTIFLYQGGLSKGRGIELLLEAFSDLDSDRNVLVCMGYGPLEALIQEKAHQQSTIFFHPAVTPDVLLNYTSSADYGVSFIEDSCLSYRYCLPNKMFEYLMAGLPVLTSNLFEMKRLVEIEGVGIVAEENTVEGFRKAIELSLNQDYEEIQKNVFSARKKYCWEEQEQVLREIYNVL
ncbi:glycosyltransferase [Vibrio anguillarum]|nr:glycosyltransferase [Vibrio anguillarum]MBF4276731.1 glycosyltransferase [Vibrio anguillarum]MBF4297485.1 glycosyltransferase [Vibrio anguillarum]MBF4361182.1 glycosyltransferase [Vibrio anguillarum]MBF4397069.1 glycosyltransferase [Vibrio anguillarum]